MGRTYHLVRSTDDAGRGIVDLGYQPENPGRGWVLAERVRKVRGVRAYDTVRLEPHGTAQSGRFYCPDDITEGDIIRVTSLRKNMHGAIRTDLACSLEVIGLDPDWLVVEQYRTAPQIVARQKERARIARDRARAADAADRAALAARKALSIAA